MARRRLAGGGLLVGRQEEVAMLASEGLTDAEIAERLSVSRGTVQQHFKRLLEKLGARSRTHAVGILWRHEVAKLSTDLEESLKAQEARPETART